MSQKIQLRPGVKYQIQAFAKRRGISLVDYIACNSSEFKKPRIQKGEM